MFTLEIMWPVLVGALVLMSALYLVAWKKKDAGLVDLGWTLGIGCAALYVAWRLDGGIRGWMIAGLAALWAFRLGSFLFAHRIRGEHEDARYQALRETLGSKAEPVFFGIFLFEGLLVLIFSLPIYAALSLPVELRVWDVIGLAWGLSAILGERLADRQLTAFRRDPAKAGQVCRDGLWGYSRHPNYFFEWLFWWAFVWASVGSSMIWLSLLGPVLMLMFLFKITGIPYTEKRALKSRGEAYRVYQQTTSIFIPWFPRKTV
jgi:steroid 5-alpha reductase family enzyme